MLQQQHANRTALATAPVRHIFGLPLDAVTKKSAVMRCQSAIETRSSLVVGMLNCSKLVSIKDDEVLRQALLSCDMIAADGMFIVWASRILGQPVPERVDGIGLFMDLLKLADTNRYSVYFLGAKQDVLNAMLRRIEKDYPRLRVAGARDGYFAPDQSGSVAQQIKASGADMVFVGMSSPRKEIFLADYGRFMEIPVCHGVGGSFDVLSGLVRRAPVTWQKLGMEWLYRLMQEPRRLGRRYVVTNAAGIALLVAELFKKPWSGRTEP